MKHLIILFSLLVVSLPTSALVQEEDSIPSTSPTTQTENSANNLVILWTSDDPMVAERVALMYTHAAKRNKWFEKVTLIIWGPSAKLAAENILVQEKIANLKTDGVIIEACSACSDAYGVTNILKQLGYNPHPMGEPLTKYIKAGNKILTF